MKNNHKSISEFLVMINERKKTPKKAHPGMLVQEVSSGYRTDILEITE